MFYATRSFFGVVLIVAALALLPVVSFAQTATPPPMAPELSAAYGLITSAKYSDAKIALDAYLGTHPGDQAALALLGAADVYLQDNAGAVTAFDAAGAIPEYLKILAASAYADAAVAALTVKDNKQALALSAKALALHEDVNNLFVHGTAAANDQQYAVAIADLEKAKARALAGKADAATLDAIDASLATAYIFGGQSDKGLALAAALKKRNPSNTRVDDTLAAYYNQQAVAKMNAGDRVGAISVLESAARAVPSRAVVLYVQAASVLSEGTSPNWKAVKAEADKALAIDSNDARANYVAGIAKANLGDSKDALPYLLRAKAYAGTDAALIAQIDAALKLLQKP
jgi:tetratricopeptide (TPR) repeat protein